MAVLNTGFSRKAEILLQTEAAECGLACLAMVATAHGHECDLRSLRQRFSTSSRGVTLGRLIADARTLGFTTRALRLEPNELRQLQLPCILHVDMNHFVVLNTCTRSAFEILDPALGIRKCTAKEISARFTGVALELTPDVEFKKQKKQYRDLSISRLLGTTRALPSSLAKVFFLAAAIEVFALVAPFLSQWAIDDALVGGDSDLLSTIIAALLLVGLLQSATEAVREYASLHLNATLNLQWFTRVCSRLLHLPLSYFEKRPLGGITARVDTLGVIQSTVSNGLIEGMIDGMMAVGTLIMMILYSTKLAAISVAALAVYVLLRLALFKAMRSSSESQFVFGAKLQTYLIESIQGIQTLKLFGKEGVRVGALANKSVQQKNAALRIARYALLFRTSNSLLFRLETAVVLGMAGAAVIEKSFTIGMFIAFTSFREQFARRVSGLVDKAFDFRMLGVQTERLADIMLEKPERFSRRYDVPASDNIFSSELRVHRLSYSYAEGLPSVLKGVEFSVSEGEHVCIVGPSGCGKTTLLKVMTGLLVPTSGDITLGNIPIKNLGKAYRQLCATVTQDDVLFAGSIAENIAFFDEFPDHTFLKCCAEMACIDEEIRQMPMGYDTLIGDMGSALSGGQKQRILLARAFYKRPKILFLDEATSHLDAAKERQILETLSRLRITRIVIAHRRETIEAADRIIELPALQKKLR